MKAFNDNQEIQPIENSKENCNKKLSDKMKLRNSLASINFPTVIQFSSPQSEGQRDDLGDFNLKTNLICQFNDTVRPHSLSVNEILPVKFDVPESSSGKKHLALRQRAILKFNKT